MLVKFDIAAKPALEDWVSTYYRIAGNIGGECILVNW